MAEDDLIFLDETEEQNTPSKDDKMKQMATSAGTLPSARLKRPISDVGDRPESKKQMQHSNTPPQVTHQTPPDDSANGPGLPNLRSNAKSLESSEDERRKLVKISLVPDEAALPPRVSIEDLKRASAMHASGPILLRSKGTVVPAPVLPPEVPASSADYLEKGAWLQTLQNHNLPPFGKEKLRCSIAWILKRGYRYKITSPLVVNLKSFEMVGQQAIFVARDPSGEMNGYLDNVSVKLYREQLGAGSALVLKDFTLFNPERGQLFLNINKNALVSVLAPDTLRPAETPAHLETNPEQLIEQLYISHREMEVLVSPVASPSTVVSSVSSASSASYGAFPPSAAALPTPPRPAPNSKAAAAARAKQQVVPALPPDHSPMVGSPHKTPTKPPPPANKSQSVQKPPPTPTEVQLVPPASKPLPNTTPVSSMPKPVPLVTPPSPVPSPIPKASSVPAPASTTALPKTPSKPLSPTVTSATPSVTVKPVAPSVSAATTVSKPSSVSTSVPKPTPPTAKQPITSPTVTATTTPALKQTTAKPPPVSASVSIPVVTAPKPMAVTKPPPAPVAKKPPPVPATYISNIAATSPLINSKPSPLSSTRPMVQTVQIVAPPPTTTVTESVTTIVPASVESDLDEERDEFEGVQPHEVEEEYVREEFFEDREENSEPNVTTTAVASTSDQFDEFADPELDAFLAQNPDALNGT